MSVAVKRISSFLALILVVLSHLEAQERFKAMVGDFVIEAGIRRSPSDSFREITGNATFVQPFGEQQIRESFILDGPRKFEGVAFINFSEAHERYELFQIDVASSKRSTIYLIGEESDGKIKFSSEQLDLPQWGQQSFQLRWEYSFYEDGSFKKEMLTRDQHGEFFVQSYYHYKLRDR